MADVAPLHPNHNSIAAEISNLVVRTMSSYTGRGPPKARTAIDGDLVTVVLRDTLSRGERRLVADGGEELVQYEKAYQMTMRGDLVAGVERLTGRRVIAFSAITTSIRTSRSRPSSSSPQPHRKPEVRP